MGFNNNELGHPLAWWAAGFLGWAMDHGLFDDPYVSLLFVVKVLVNSLFYEKFDIIFIENEKKGSKH